MQTLGKVFGCGVVFAVVVFQSTRVAVQDQGSEPASHDDVVPGKADAGYLEMRGVHWYGIARVWSTA